MTQPVIDQEAPYGRKLDGTPRKRAGRPPGSKNRNPRGPRATSGTAVGESPYSRAVVTEHDEDQEPAAAASVPEGSADEGGLSRDPLSAIGDGLSAAASSSARGGQRGARVTVAVKKDVTAKVAFMLGLPAGMWKMADQHCGTVAVESVPGVAETLGEIICDSPDLVKWFTSGGNYIRYLELVTRLQALAVAVYQHHIAHSVPEAGAHDATWFDPRRFPAVVPTPAAG